MKAIEHGFGGAWVVGGSHLSPRVFTGGEFVENNVRLWLRRFAREVMTVDDPPSKRNQYS